MCAGSGSAVTATARYLVAARTFPADEAGLVVGLANLAGSRPVLRIPRRVAKHRATSGSQHDGSELAVELAHPRRGPDGTWRALVGLHDVDGSSTLDGFDGSIEVHRRSWRPIVEATLAGHLRAGRVAVLAPPGAAPAGVGHTLDDVLAALLELSTATTHGATRRRP